MSDTEWDKVYTKQAQIELDQRNAAQLRADLATKTRALAERETECERLRAQNADWQASIGNMATVELKSIEERDTLRAQLAERDREIERLRTFDVAHLQAQVEQLTRSRDHFQREETALRVRLSEWMAPYDQAKADFLRRSCEALGRTGLSLPQVYYEIEQLRLSACEPVVEAVREHQRHPGDAAKILRLSSMRLPPEKRTP
jgi:chromosome segregation ATPase